MLSLITYQSEVQSPVCTIAKPPLRVERLQCLALKKAKPESVKVSYLHNHTYSVKV